MVIDKEIAVAGAALTVDVVSGHENSQVGYRRFLVACGLSGSAAIGDTLLSVRVGGREVDKLRNQELGLAIAADKMLATRALVRANTPVQVIVEDAPLTNPIRLRMVFVP